MSICYIILTCEAYLPTRARYLLETSLKNVNPNDIYFLSCKKKEPNVYGWDTADDYESCPTKYVRFFQNMKLDYDWYYFMDDDTFIFPNRLHKFLTNFNKNDDLYIGNRCKHLSFPLYMSGGAGFVMTKSLYIKLTDYIRLKTDNELLKDRHGDLLLGIWLTDINKQMIDSELFNPNIHNNDNQLQNCISFHYLKNEQQYKFYDTFN